MATTPRNTDDSKSIVVRRGRVESVDLYEIKDTELDTLEKGTPADLQLNFAVFLLSIAFSAFGALTTATFANKTIETCFIVTTVVGVLIGAYLLISWWRTRSEVRELCKKIRQRIPPDAVDHDEDDPDLQASLSEGGLEEESPKG